MVDDAIRAYPEASFSALSPASPNFASSIRIWPQPYPEFSAPRRECNESPMNWLPMVMLIGPVVGNAQAEDWPMFGRDRATNDRLSAIQEKR